MSEKIDVLFFVLTFLKKNLLKPSHKKLVSPIVHLNFSKKVCKKVKIRFYFSAHENDRKKNGHLFFAPMYIGQVKVRWYSKVHNHANGGRFCVTRA